MPRVVEHAAIALSRAERRRIFLHLNGTRGQSCCGVHGRRGRAPQSPQQDLHTAALRTDVLRSLVDAHEADCQTCLQPVSPAARAGVRAELDRRRGAAGADEAREPAKVVTSAGNTGSSEPNSF